jgi:hypothetical protein
LSALTVSEDAEVKLRNFLQQHFGLDDAELNWYLSAFYG